MGPALTDLSNGGRHFSEIYYTMNSKFAPDEFDIQYRGHNVGNAVVMQ